MNIVAIRGAITAANTKEEILTSTKELLERVIQVNQLKIENILQITFTCTKDLDAVYPAVAARKMGITEAALMCMQEMSVIGALDHCIRIAVLYQTEGFTQQQVKPVYLKGALVLRPDLTHYTIAIDGPAGAGKSTIAKELAKKLQCTYIDTGAMYRSVGLYCIEKGLDYTKEEVVNSVLDQIHIDLEYQDNTQKIYLNHKDVSETIRTQEVATAASKVGTYGKVRSALVDMQRKLAATKSVVMDGRDIGTVVLPQATLKVFLTASPDERARRRFKEYEQKGMIADYNALLQEIKDRDYQDANRSVSPLKKADDAIEIDSTKLPVEDILEYIFKLLQHAK